MPSARIALDVMGGDKAPDAIVRGALLAVSKKFRQPLPVERILLVGDEKLVRAKLEEFGGDPGFAVRHATQVVGMAESPAAALRSKPWNVTAKRSRATTRCCRSNPLVLKLSTIAALRCKVYCVPPKRWRASTRRCCSSRIMPML